MPIEDNGTEDSRTVTVHMNGGWNEDGKGWTNDGDIYSCSVLYACCGVTLDLVLGDLTA